MVNGQCGLNGAAVLPNVTVVFRLARDNVINRHQQRMASLVKGILKNGECAILYTVQVGLTSL